MRIPLTLALIAMSASPALARPPRNPLAGLKPAGAPQDCISLRQVPDSTILDGSTIVYRGTGRAYVNHPPGGCPGLRPDLAISTRTPSDRLCRGDLVTVFDPRGGIPHGSCTLGPFEPYRR